MANSQWSSRIGSRLSKASDDSKAVEYTMIQERAMQNICIVYDLFKVNFNFGPPVCDEEPISSSTSMADTGGLVASGEGTAAGKPNA